MKDSKGHGSDARAAQALANGHPKAAPPRTHGAFKVQAFSSKLAGSSWGTKKSYGNRATAERVAQHMRTDGGYMRVRSK